MVEHSNTLLELNNVCVDYEAANGVVHAVSNVSLTLRRGEILGLAGESGSGKSTLAYAIMRLLRPPAVITGGEVLYYPRKRSNKDVGSRTTPDVIDILQLTPAQMRSFRWRELAIVFQSAMNALNPVMTIGSQIMDVLRTHRPDMGANSRKRRAQELLKLVGIAPDRLNSFPHELSGGMRQRAMIAISLALSPDLIIMDEPTTALDVVMQREILMEITRLRKELDFAVIFITHDLSLLLEMADKIAIMYAGRLVETASCREIYAHPRHPYSYGLINSFPSLHGERRYMTGIPGSPPDLRAVPSGCSFHPRCAMAFDACSRSCPELCTATPDIPGQHVACHLYNTRYQSAPPTTGDLASSYQALAERINI
ncbi:MAG: ABC transporter ATP-binding protein [Ktedonobacteraceae bacterium]|nr:ABC transporter ATP-binding protein [Ktedonobacteraceae bacterium]